VKALFVGLGSIGQRHLRNLRQIVGDDLELIAYRTQSSSPLLSAAGEVVGGRSVDDEYGITVCSSLEESLSHEPDIAVISNPTRLHVETAAMCAEAGCHLFIEKPLSDQTDGIERLVSAVKEAGVVATVGYQMRFHPSISALRKMIESGDLGSPVSASLTIGEYLPGWHPWEDYRGGYAAVEQLGGGAIATQSHEFDYASVLFGPPKSVFAVGGQLSDLELDVEDVVLLLADHGAGSKQFPVQYNLDYVRRSPVRKCEIIFHHGAAELDLLTSSVKIYGQQDEEDRLLEWPDFDRNDLFIEEMKDFLGAINGSPLRGASIGDGIANVNLIAAAKQSLVTRSVENVGKNE
jgi:predicted dehydrogenase